MVHRLSIIATNFCIGKKWIDASMKEWGIYVFENKLLHFIFVVFLFLCAVIVDRPLEVVTFSSSLCCLRRRIGGWHANKAYSCQILSIVVVLSTVVYLGPVVTNLDFLLIALLDIGVLLWGFIVEPCYPPQMHFSSEEIIENKKRKNKLLLFIMLVQSGALIFKNQIIFVYAGLGVFMGIISVYIERICQKRKDEKEYEKQR